MMKSMTAYGRTVLPGEDRDITVEIRSVNSRYFDCSVRMPHALAALEERIKGFLRSEVISRGKVDVSISCDYHAGARAALALDDGYLAVYLPALRELRDRYGLADDLSVMRVAANSAVFRTVRTEIDTDAEWKRLSEALKLAGESHRVMRSAEGDRIRSDLEGKLRHVAECADRIEILSANDSGGYREKLEGRLRTILADNRVTVDENRILTECAIYADRIAIDEELVRLRSHFGAFAEISGERTPSGKKLDFLMQELNRETNTIGSKANNSEIAHLVVEMKNELEKIREQVQNIE
jgi:uncharacterized protein (TIGR00255 family)